MRTIVDRGERTIVDGEGVVENSTDIIIIIFLFPWAPLCLGPPLNCVTYTRSPAALIMTVNTLCGFDLVLNKM